MPVWLLSVGKFLLGVATIAIPIPLWLIGSIYGGWYFASWWHTSAAVKAAVEARVTEMITGAEKAALEEQLKATEAYGQAQHDLLIEAQRREAVTKVANSQLQDEVDRQTEKAEDAEKRWKEMLAKPLVGTDVGPDLYNRLRSK